MKHMLKHEVFDEPEYEGYYNLSKNVGPTTKSMKMIFLTHHEYEEEGWFA